jgi:hypothetical protein
MLARRNNLVFLVVVHNVSFHHSLNQLLPLNNIFTAHITQFPQLNKMFCTFIRFFIIILRKTQLILHR